MIALTILGIYLLTLPLTSWILYLAAMNLERQKDEGKLTDVSEAWGASWVWFAFVQDAILTATWGTVLFLDWPRELTFTKRLQRYHVTAAGTWRNSFAEWFCVNLLNGGDNSGRHC